MALNIENININNIDEEWSNFILKSGNNDENEEKTDNNNFDEIYNYQQENIPEASEIYISTKSKIAYLNMPINLKIFWNIPIILYSMPKNGVIKKQMKFVSTSEEEVNEIKENLKNEVYFDEYIMSHVDNPSGRIKYKDIRKVTVGISKKDIMSYRTKKKQAFYNCFVMIIRLKVDEIYKEFHVKVFNTGKLEIPGIQNDNIFELVLENVINILQPFIEEKLTYNTTSDTVLINSNFNCGFYINREVLFDLLKYKYKIHAIYDPCSYPGIQCKFYYNKSQTIQNGVQNSIQNNDKKNIVEVSFMIFRTGSVLIVGMCDEYMLVEIYNFLKNIFKTEFHQICHQVITKSMKNNKDKRKKIRKRTIIIKEENTLLVDK